jgi:hypothetical protein
MLWSDKVYVPERFVQKVDGSKHAYWNSIKDSTRTSITEEELCSFVWSFRFKESAGQYWLEDDPWWHNKPATRMVFSSKPDRVVSILDEHVLGAVRRRWRFQHDTRGLSPNGKPEI